MWGVSSFVRTVVDDVSEDGRESERDNSQELHVFWYWW
jgi:hypothetical protein